MSHAADSVAAAPGLTFHEITRLDDDVLLPWLDLYEAAFPPAEKVPVSEHLRALKERDPAAPGGACLLAALDGEGELVGMARYDVDPEARAAYLMYLAVAAGRRSGGLGSALYREILRRLDALAPPARALIFEVERPDQAASPEQARLAGRRIEFYRRLGARLLRGIDYLQEVPGHPPVPMFLMVHPRQPLTAADAVALADQLLGVTRAAEPPALE